MPLPPDAIESALNDLAAVRRAIELAGSATAARTDASQLLVQGVALALATALLLLELLTGEVNGRVLLASADSADLRWSTLALLGALLALMVATLYFLVYRASRLAQQDFPRFVARNFAYLKNLSFLADLLVKFAVLALVVHLRHPEFTGPLLTLFVGDYLMQGRFFTLPLRTAMGLGLACLGSAAALVLTGYGLLTAPLAVFIAVCALSVGHQVRQRRARA